MILPLSLSRYEVRTDLFLLGTQLEDLIEQFNTPPSVTDEVQTGASESLDSFECQSDETVGDEMIELFDELSQLQEVVEKIEADMEKLAVNTQSFSSDLAIEPAQVELARINSAVERAQRARYVGVGRKAWGHTRLCGGFFFQTLLEEAVCQLNFNKE